MSIHIKSLAEFAIDAARGLGRILDRRKPAPTPDPAPEPAPPVVASMPRQRRPMRLVPISDAEKEAMIRARACQLAGFRPCEADMDAIAVIVLRADLAAWDNGATG